MTGHGEPRPRTRRARAAPRLHRRRRAHRRAGRRSACSAASRTTASCPPTRSAGPTPGCRQLHRHPHLRGVLAAAAATACSSRWQRPCSWSARSAMAAFVFARFAFRGREFLFTLFAIGLMFPFAVAILPLFVLLRGMGLLDNPLGVILPQAAFGLPITIIILRAVLPHHPRRGRGGGHPRRLRPVRVLLADPAADGPARPGHRLGAGRSSTSWNNFMLPLVVFTDQSWWTLPLGVQAVPGPVRRRHRPGARLRRAVHGAGPGLLRRRRTPAHRRPGRQRQGMTPTCCE